MNGINMINIFEEIICDENDEHEPKYILIESKRDYYKYQSYTFNKNDLIEINDKLYFIQDKIYYIKKNIVSHIVVYVDDVTKDIDRLESYGY